MQQAGNPYKITPAVKQYIEDAICENSTLTIRQLKTVTFERFGIDICAETIRKIKLSLGITMPMWKLQAR